MSAKSIYDQCPVYRSNRVTLRQTADDDAKALLACYSDEKAIPLFNADNCPDDFHYTTLEQMKDEISFWNTSYQKKWFVRWTIIHNDSLEIIGTVEMFNKGILDEIGPYGVLRIDLRSDYEKRQIVQSILDIAERHFYDDFKVKGILTKAVPEAKERIAALNGMGYEPVPFQWPHYFAGKQK